MSSENKARKAAEILKNAAKKGEEAVRTGIEKSKPHAERLTKATVEKTKEVAVTTTDKVARGVHRAMGSDDYRREAEAVNMRLMEALRTLEDSIRRRDRDIEQLRAHIADLQAQLKAQNVGK